MKYCIYKTTNIINGKFYWGVHNSLDENDGYLGSGLALRNAIKKYGKESFRRETKFLYKTIKEAYADEALIVNKSMINNPMCYNMATGGSISVDHTYETRQKISAAMMGNKSALGHKHSEISKQKMSMAFKGKPKSEEHKQKLRIPKSEEARLNMSIAQKGKHHSEETKRKISEGCKGNMSHTGQPLSEETKMKISKYWQERRSEKNGTKNISILHL